MAVPPSARSDKRIAPLERPTHTQTWVVLVLGFVGFVTSFGAHIVAVNLPVYAKQVGVGVAVIGLLIASYDFAEIIAKPLFGALADRRGMKQTMLAGILLFTLASLAYPWIDPQLLLFIRVLQGVGAAALSAVSLALVGAYFPDRRGRAYGLYNAIKGVGYVVSPVIGVAVVWKSNFAAIFLAAAAVGVIAFLASLWLPGPMTRLDRSFEDDVAGFSLTGLRIALSQRMLWPWYLVTTINMFFVGILFGFLPVRVYALGYAPLITGLLLSAATTSYLLVQPVAGAVADRVDPAWTIRLGLALAGLNIILVPFVRGIPLVVVSVLAGIGIGTVWTNTDALVSSLADKRRLGATMGVAGSFKEFGDMVGPVLIGLVSQVFGLAVGFVACGILGLVAIGLIKQRPNPSHAGS
jgi:MFS family permease